MREVGYNVFPFPVFDAVNISAESGILSTLAQKEESDPPSSKTGLMEKKARVSSPMKIHKRIKKLFEGTFYNNEVSKIPHEPRCQK